MPTPVDLLRSAVASVLTDGLADQAAAPMSAFDVVLAATRPRGVVDRGAYDAALARALARVGQAVVGLQVVERTAAGSLQQAAGRAAAATQSLCCSAVAEVYFLNGWLTEAASAARTALGYAEEAGDDAARVRALELAAACGGFSGAFDLAGRAMATVVELRAAHHWAAPSSSWPFALAELSLAVRRKDPLALRATCQALEVPAECDLIAAAVLGYGRALLWFAVKDYQRVSAVALTMSSGTDAKRSPPFLVNVGLGLGALAMSNLGEPANVLRLVGARASDPSHVVCFDLLRASAFLALDRPRDALAVTDGCLRDSNDHNLVSLASVLLRRALAFELLEQPREADSAFSRACHLAVEIGAVTATLGLPRDLLGRLLVRLSAADPAFGAELRLSMPGADHGTVPSTAVLGARLTNREVELVLLLKRGLLFSEIASELVVSVNTVRTHAASLYRKLGVTSRTEAVAVLEDEAFFDVDPRAR